MECIRVGAFELYPGERQLCAGGKPIELGARAFDLLLVLVENPGRLVSKATLLERVWPRLVVDENNLPAQIATLRRVLGAGAIRTVPRFGYRLDLEVSTAETAGQEAAPAVPPRAGPSRLTPLFGREDDLRAVQQALARSCLVSVVGGAGIGKTRLAHEIQAREMHRSLGAVAWVSLEPVADAAHVPSAIALALGLTLPEGSDRFGALRQALVDTDCLLILDGAEHLGPALAQPLSALIGETRGLRLLLTSQVPLGISGETVCRLAPLPVPEAGAAKTEIAQYAAVALFARRAAESDRRFELSGSNAAAVGEICRRLDGNPLALELAAARVAAFGVAVLCERLDDRFRLLKQAGPADDPRHGVLRAAFDWSYGLLSEPEQKVFDRLGAFAGSFSLKTAAQAVADERIDPSDAIDLIGRLVDRSLVTVLGGDPPRYTLLETARCYALDRLKASDQLEAAQWRMAGTLLDLLDRAYEEYWSLDEEIWRSQYEPEIDNVRAALAWAKRSDSTLAVSLYGSSWPLFVETDLHAEGRAGHAEAVGLLSDRIPGARIGRFWEATATYDSTRQWDRARYAAELAVKRHAASGDLRARYFALLQLALNWRGESASAQTAFEAARQVEEPAWPARLLAQGAMTEGALLASRGQYLEAREAYRRALSFALTISERQALAATVQIVELDIACGATDAALQLGRPLAISLRRVGRRETRFELLVLTFSALLLAGETEEARAIGAELHELAMRLDPGKLFTVLDAMALYACLEGRTEAAARIAACADSAHEKHGQARRRPAEERLRSALAAKLQVLPAAAARSGAAANGGPLDEAGACRLALGLG